LPYLLGIDEAGYGPNLGPFVMSSALFSLPDGCSTDLWKVLRKAVRKAHHKADGRLIVDDSKRVYSPNVGLGALERNIWPFIQLTNSSISATDDLWNHCAVDSMETVSHEPYVQWSSALPHSPAMVSSAAILVGVMNHTGITLKRLQSSIIAPRQFNQLTRQADSKAAIPLHSIRQLVASLPCDDVIEIHIDKLPNLSVKIV